MMVRRALPAAAKRLFALVLAGLTAASCMPIEDPSRPVYEPARFEPDLYLKTMPFPDVGTTDVTIHCSTTIRSGWRRPDVACDQEEENPDFFTAVTHYGGRFLKSTLPRKNGIRVQTAVEFRVRFKANADGQKSIELFQNDGQLVDELGDDYLSPQLIWDAVVGGRLECDPRITGRVEVLVGKAGGLPETVDVTLDEPNPKCAEGLEHRYSQYEFIPGYHDGKPAQMKLFRRLGQTRGHQWKIDNSVNSDDR